MRFDFVASWPHFDDHLRPVWEGLPEDMRGTIGRYPPARGEVLVAAATSDYQRALGRKGRPVVLFAHGAGFSYKRVPFHSSYPGGLSRGEAALMPVPNRWAAERNLAAYPSIPSPIVGCPKLDAMILVADPGEGVVALAFHWDCTIVPETRWALPHFRSALPELADRFRGRIIGHGHPRERERIEAAFLQAGIPFVAEFSEVVRRASVYVVDTSSTLFEFAALGRPVVVLNAPWYRRDVHHGLRFWDHADVGLNIDEPEELADGIAHALADPEEFRGRREEAVAAVYPFLGRSVAQAVSVLGRWADEREEA